MLKLFPQARREGDRHSSRCPSSPTPLSLFGLAQETAGQSLTAFEFMPRTVLDMVLRNVRNTRDPFSDAHPWYVLMEISGLKADGTADRLLTEILEAASEQGLIIDARHRRARWPRRSDFWRLREGVSEAQKPEGGNIKNDVSVPIAKIPEFIARANAAVLKAVPRRAPAAARPLRRRQRALQHRPAHRHGRRPSSWRTGTTSSAPCTRSCCDFDGSISAEHGIGQMKREELAKAKGDVAMDLMRRIKAALDPKGILNPGKVL